jgi:hypothetical protein
MSLEQLVAAVGIVVFTLVFIGAMLVFVRQDENR